MNYQQLALLLNIEQGQIIRILSAMGFDDYESVEIEDSALNYIESVVKEMEILNTDDVMLAINSIVNKQRLKAEQDAFSQSKVESIESLNLKARNRAVENTLFFNKMTDDYFQYFIEHGINPEFLNDSHRKAIEIMAEQRKESMDRLEQRSLTFLDDLVNNRIKVNKALPESTSFHTVPLLPGAKEGATNQGK